MCRHRRIPWMLAGLCLMVGPPTRGQLLPDQSELLPGTTGGGSLGTRIVAGDFDGDGRDELVVSDDAPGGEPGTFHVYWQGSDGTYQRVHTFDDGPVQIPVACDIFPTTPGDELIVGLPASEVPGTLNPPAEAGWVRVYRWSGNNPAGRSADPLRGATWDVVVDFDQSDVGGVIEAGDHFGGAIATGDLDGDRICDLLVAAPLEDDNGVADAGVVHVLGGPVGFGDAPSTLGTLVEPTIVPPAQEAGDRFGTTLLIAPRLEGAFTPTLVVGAPDEDVTESDAGVVWLFPTDGAGSPQPASAVLGAALLGLPEGTQGAADRFGAALAVGDLNGDDLDELVIGIPGSDVAGIGNDTGRVYIGLSDSETDLILTSSAAGSRFGSALALGEMTGDLHQDLAVGAPRDVTVGSRGNSTPGSVTVYRGVDSGTAFTALLRQSDFPGEDQDNERMGETLALADRDGDGTLDLAIGLPQESPDGGPSLAGAVRLVPTVGRVRRATIIARAGQEMSDFAPARGTEVVGLIGSPVVDGSGNAVYSLFGDFGTWALVSEDVGVFVSQGGGLLLAGGSAASSQRLAWARAGLSIESDAGVLAEVGGAGPDGQSWDSFESPRVDDHGAVLWSGRSNSFATDSLVRNPTGAPGAFTTLLQTGDVVDGVTVDRIFLEDIGHVAGSLAAVDFDGGEGLWLDGSLVWRSDQVFAPLGLQVLDSGAAATNSHGDFVFGANLDLDDSLTERFVSGSGSSLGGQGQVGAFELGRLQARGVGVDDRGGVAMIFTSPGVDGHGFVAALACSADALETAAPILATGDRLDLDGDGVGDAAVVQSAGGFQISPAGDQPEVDPAGRLVLRVALDLFGGTEPVMALIGLEARNCPFFADGFETGDTTNWSVTQSGGP